MIREIPIQFSELPTSIVVPLNGIDYELVFAYNVRFDFVTVEIWKDLVLLSSTKIVYGSDFTSQVKEIPFRVMPLTIEDITRDGFSSVQVNKDTFGKSVLLVFEDGVE